jgi:hypothetical protein
MDIKSYVTELQSIKLELQKRSVETRRLRNEEKRVEEQITNYLDMKGQDGVTYKGWDLIIQKKDKHKRVKKQAVMDSTIDLLKRNGVKNAELLYNELNKVKIGSPITNRKLKISTKSE